MSEPVKNCPTHDRQAGHCLARSVAATLAEEPALEAVTIDRAHRKISLATLGRADVPRLTGRITSQFETAQAADTGHVCSLLSGDGDCFSCDTPLPESERNRITIRHDGDITTIARMTCPTARCSGAGATCRFRKSSRATLSSWNTPGRLMNGNCNWPPRFCAGCSASPDFFHPRRSKSFVTSRPVWRADFIRLPTVIAANEGHGCCRSREVWKALV